MNVTFYIETYKNQKEGYKSKAIKIAECFCPNKECLKYQIIGIAYGAALKYKHFRACAYDNETGKLIDSCTHYNLK